jgi:hypothetical protein
MTIGKLFSQSDFFEGLGLSAVIKITRFLSLLCGYLSRKCAEAANSVSVWARHLDRAADSGLRLPAVWQQFLNAAVHV